MSNGNNIPYHLRHNKAIERNLFVDLLFKINKEINISEYTYVSFGGPYLEDFKIIHNAIKIKKMISLEQEINTHNRQQFNMPLSCISIGKNPETASEFINRYIFDGKSIVWLDYTEPAKINEQLNEIEALTNKLKPYDIFKVTLNAHSETLGRDASKSYSTDPREYRASRLEEILDQYCPYQIEADNVSSKKYPKVLLDAIKKASFRGVSSRKNIIVQPLSSFIYADGQTMLTATAIILEKNELANEKFFEDSRLNTWPFLERHWNTSKKINIPLISIKERMHIEAMLPNSSPEEIIKSMGFNISDSKRETIDQLNTFIEYQRAIPWFSKVQI
ncbi:Uncharacterised protein [Serratia quinivorans]|uniref:O-methyltransferase n=1 Tax=Serratia quinivorans TaxID=137545 RepID=UPI00217BCBAE|nr:O-methyltransferase [Serratia quinivorans]CAI1870734.1 Uncharacterised protein [Serratia quinivorans]